MKDQLFKFKIAYFTPSQIGNLQELIFLLLKKNLLISGIDLFIIIFVIKVHVSVNLGQYFIVMNPIDWTTPILLTLILQCKSPLHTAQ